MAAENGWEKQTARLLPTQIASDDADNDNVSPGESLCDENTTWVSSVWSQ